MHERFRSFQSSQEGNCPSLLTSFVHILKYKRQLCISRGCLKVATSGNALADFQVFRVALKAVETAKKREENLEELPTSNI